MVPKKYLKVKVSLKYALHYIGQNIKPAAYCFYFYFYFLSTVCFLKCDLKGYFTQKFTFSHSYAVPNLYYWKMNKIFIRLLPLSTIKKYTEEKKPYNFDMNVNKLFEFLGLNF